MKLITEKLCEEMMSVTSHSQKKNTHDVLINIAHFRFDLFLFYYHDSALSIFHFYFLDYFVFMYVWPQLNYDCAEWSSGFVFSSVLTPAVWMGALFDAVVLQKYNSSIDHSVKLTPSQTVSKTTQEEKHQRLLNISIINNFSYCNSWCVMHRSSDFHSLYSHCTVYFNWSSVFVYMCLCVSVFVRFLLS